MPDVPAVPLRTDVRGIILPRILEDAKAMLIPSDLRHMACTNGSHPIFASILAPFLSSLWMVDLLKRIRSQQLQGKAVIRSKRS